MTKSKNVKIETLYSILFLIPALLLFISFIYYPLIMTVKYSITDWDGFSKSYNIVGIKNFINIFKDSDTYTTILNTIYLAVLVLVIGTIAQLGLALIIDQNIKGSVVLKTIYYIPCVISGLIVGLTWTSFLQYTGIINEFLRIIHANSLIQDWLADPHIVKNVIVFVNTWQWTGYGLIIYLTGLNGVPVEVNEASLLDGASGFKKFRYVTLPLIMPAVTVSGFIGITGSLKMFDLPFILTGGGPMNSSTTITMSIYKNAFSANMFGYSSSIGLTFFLFIAVITIIQLRVTRNLEVEY